MRTRTLRSRLSLATFGAFVALSVASFSSGGTASAQTISIPTYGPPTAPIMQGYEAHVFRTFQLSVSVVVPLAQLQSILPAGFIALANPAGSDTAQVGMSLIFYQRSERAATGADGPASVLAVTALVRNSLLSRNETVLLANEQNNPTSVANANSLFGEGTTRLADIEALIEEKKDSLRFRFEATDKDLRLRVKLQAFVPSLALTTVRQDSVATPFRALNGIIAGNSYFGANRYDVTTMTITEDNFDINVPQDVLHLPGGDLAIVGMGATIGVQRWRDNYFKLDGL